MAPPTLTDAPVHIRSESPDQPAVRALLQALDDYLATLYEPEHNHILGLQALRAPDICFLVARRHGQVVGCGAFRRHAGEPATGGEVYGEIKRMMVDPAARGQGIGAALLEQVEREARAQGARALSLTTATNNPARRLYERAGFRVTETRTDPEFEAATGVAGRVLMVKAL